MGIFDEIIADEELRAKVDELHEETLKIQKDDLETDFNGRLETEVSGLKTKNEEILGEKKTIQKQLALFDGLDAEEARAAMELVENNDDIQMIKDGKMEELIEKKTSQMRSDHEAELSDLSVRLKDALSRGDKYENLFNTKTVDDALREAATTAKVRPEAVTDILLRGRGVFSVGEDGQSVEARGTDGKLAKTEDGKIINTKNWIESLKETSPHYWPESTGAGARGGRGGGSSSDLQARMDDAAARGDMKTYRKLQAQKRKAAE